LQTYYTFIYTPTNYILNSATLKTYQQLKKEEKEEEVVVEK